MNSHSRSASPDLSIIQSAGTIVPCHPATLGGELTQVLLVGMDGSGTCGRVPSPSSRPERHLFFYSRESSARVGQTRCANPWWRNTGGAGRIGMRQEHLGQCLVAPAAGARHV